MFENRSKPWNPSDMRARVNGVTVFTRRLDKTDLRDGDQPTFTATDIHDDSAPRIRGISLEIGVALSSLQGAPRWRQLHLPLCN